MPSLEQTIRISLSDFHIKRIRRIDEEDFSPIKKKYMKDCMLAGNPVTEEYVDRGILALKQYYAVALLDPNNSHAVSDTVDPLWHTHMLFSQRYMDFCNDVVGVYMHHMPLDHDYELGVENVAKLYDYTREVLDLFFEQIDEHFWPRTMPRERLICWHKGNQGVYADEIYRHAILPADERGINYAFH